MTKINLRKAAAAVHALGLEINTRRAAVAAEALSKMSVFGDYDNFSANQRKKFDETKMSLDSITDVLFSIRQKVSEANAKHCIDALLNKIVLIDNKIVNENGILKIGIVDVNSDKQKLEVMKEKQKASSSDYYGAIPDEISVSVITEQDVSSSNDKVSALKKEKRKLQDELLSANLECKITLSAEEEKVLDSLGLI